MKALPLVAMCTAVSAMGCEPKLALQLDRHGETYAFELRREDNGRGFGAESFGVMDGSRVICEIRHAPGPGTRVSRWIYGSRPDGYAISPTCEALQPGRTYRVTAGGRLVATLVFRPKADGDLEMLPPEVP